MGAEKREKREAKEKDGAKSGSVGEEEKSDFIPYQDRSLRSLARIKTKKATKVGGRFRELTSSISL